MGRSGMFDDEYGLDFDDTFAGQPDYQWPVDEAELAEALSRGRPLNEIARKYGVSVAEVAELAAMYDLDLD